MNEGGSISLMVSVPVCSFRKGFAREYLETEEVPPPSTVYGFLLALVGEEDRNAYLGTELAYAITQQPDLSVILRTVWRIKDKNVPPGTGKNKRPDYQEILTGLEMVIFVKAGDLAERIRAGCLRSGQVERYGGLSLGESRDLVNDIVLNPDCSGKVGNWLVCNPAGEHPLPLWVDHVGSKDTVWGQFSLQENKIIQPDSDDPSWIPIRNNQ